MAGVLILLLWFLVIPTVTGAVVINKLEPGVGQGGRLLSLWVCGQMILWAVFQLICVPFVLLQRPFATNFSKPFTGENSLISVVSVYLSCVLVLLAGGLFSMHKWYRKNRITVLPSIESAEEEKRLLTKVLWVVFWVLLLFQMVQAVRMTYGDGDDAYYVAVSAITEESNFMYLKLPYTGGSTGLDIRHGLAPFPVWIAFLAKLSGVRTVSVAHVAVPLALIPMTYAIYALIGRRLCKDHPQKMALFLILTQLLVLFGDYSFYTAENFMIARSRQGKAALGNIVIPMILYLLCLILERLTARRKIEGSLWILLTCTIITGCLCSTLGALLTCMLVGITGLCAAFCYRKWKMLFPMALCCLPAVGYAVLYLIL